MNISFALNYWWTFWLISDIAIKLFTPEDRYFLWHYNDVIMGVIASQITCLIIVCSMVYSDADQRKLQRSASLAFVRGIHRGLVNSPHKWPVRRKMFPFDDVIMESQWCLSLFTILTAPGRRACTKWYLVYSHRISYFSYQVTPNYHQYGPSSMSPHIVSRPQLINSLTPRRCGNNLKSKILKLIILNSSLCTNCEIVLRWM